jgi:hypothetical protein
MHDSTVLQQDIAPQDLGDGNTVTADSVGSGRVGLEAQGVTVGGVEFGSRVEVGRIQGLSGRELQDANMSIFRSGQKAMKGDSRVQPRPWSRWRRYRCPCYHQRPHR